jgi:hypothetical protein
MMCLLAVLSLFAPSPRTQNALCGKQDSDLAKMF